MKKLMNSIMALTAAIMLFGMSANTAKAQSTLKGQAIAAAASAGCLQGTGGHCDFAVSENVVSICFVSGFITEVTIYRVCDNCTPNQQPCPRPIAEPVAVVSFGCGGEVVSVTCL